MAEIAIRPATAMARFNMVTPFEDCPWPFVAAPVVRA
jgi:hypothetical protein